MRRVGVVSIMIILARVVASTQASPSCNVVISELTPCISYLMRTATTPLQQCCNGVTYLANYSTNKADRVSICRCLEASVAMFPRLDFSLLSRLPASCGVSLTLPPISPTFDCSKS